MEETRTIEQQLSDLQDRYNVLASEHRSLKDEHKTLGAEVEALRKERDDLNYALAEQAIAIEAAS